MTDAVINEFQAIPTTAVSDAMDGLNNLDPSIKPLKEDYHMVGRALTVKTSPGDNSAVLKAIHAAEPGDVLVIDAKGDTYRGVAGDFVLGMAQTLGINGFVVDGAIRDLVDCKALNFPVFCKATTIAASEKNGLGQINVPITCGGVSVQPGDLVIGDADGVTVVPKDLEDDVLSKARKKLDKDQARDEKVSGSKEAIKQYLEDMISKAYNK
ncbi:RraA family protein [Salipaludibacillus sp. CUR1]|uniref:RraA family protein n=1 Tax=Salipaludibacillus sp. CUR1 TaxID=2820003 RepID=UPI001E3252F6|nr:RraA family protein [Salipaludibacillus sp. CUR1]MCE7791715.1 RraA family protein [Salipaludibacillus sp. CUR1]